MSQNKLAESPAYTSELAHLLTSFQAESLDDGNEITGINLLSSMAVILANLAHPGSCIITSKGRRLEVGCNLMASGSQVSSSVLNEAVAPVRRCQNTLLAQLTRLAQKNKDEAAREANRRWKLNNTPKQSQGEESLFDLMAGDPDRPPLFGSRINQWVDAVTIAPSESSADVITKPRVFIAATTPSLLEQQIPSAHQGQPLVAINLNQPEDAAKFSGLCPNLIDGLIPAGAAGETLRGRLLVTDTLGQLREIGLTGGGKSAWLTRLLWLVDGNKGSVISPQTVDEKPTSLDNLHLRYERAIQRAFATRLNQETAGPATYKCDLVVPQRRWVSFLGDMETSCPGITCAARGLFSSLVFGLHSIVAVAKRPDQFHYSIVGIEALARWLVQRMVNYRAALVSSTSEARRMKDKRRILTKLTEGSLITRTIYHSLHLGADYCRELLVDLADDRYLTVKGNSWTRVKGRSLPQDYNDQLQLEG